MLKIFSFVFFIILLLRYFLLRLRFSQYILLSFDGYKLTEVLNEKVDKGIPEFARAVLADEYFYIMSYDEFKVIKLYN